MGAIFVVAAVAAYCAAACVIAGLLSTWARMTRTDCAYMGVFWPITLCILAGAFLYAIGQVVGRRMS